MACFPWTAKTSQLISCELVIAPGQKALWTPGESGLLHTKPPRLLPEASAAPQNPTNACAEGAAADHRSPSCAQEWG